MMQAPRYLSKINQIPGICATFIHRIPDVEVDNDREAIIERLKPAHHNAVEELGFQWNQLHRAEQVHGSNIAIVGKCDRAQTWPNVDGLITAEPKILLGIYVADCGAVYIVDEKKGVIALLHSGKKGTEEGITSKAIAMMKSKFGSDPNDLHVALAPCIRPPQYEVDFAADIRKQVMSAGVSEGNLLDSAICTASDLQQYYSYRAEKGCTGRMLALLGRK